MLNKVSGDDKNYLDLNELEVGQQRCSVAFVHNVRSKMAENSNGFYSFLLKDKNANIISGTLFNVSNFVDVGFEALALKNKPVKINYVVRNYEGNKVLGLIDIEVYQGEFDFSMFLGSVKNAKDLLDVCNSTLEKVLDSNYLKFTSAMLASISNIYAGRYGGFIKLSEMSLMSLLGLNNIEGLDMVDLVTVYNKVIQEYHRYLIQQDTLDFKTTSDDLNTLLAVTRRTSDNNIGRAVIDTMSILLGLSKSGDIYSHLVSKCILESKESLDLLGVYPSLARGGNYTWEENVLLKY